ncbi:uncharacterized protein PFB0765w-like [Nylanderia fulva]|uniref:uncharacterized protein PFB0765w-like n=1 Tax=Nylanderia fulva TaxID=613905 RepID=UPI0010FBA94C|nr:uncharacterized protein PFB0765w-like [Nylanderia fulva]XP_029168555.1 uncharacterized protein PFB0765w-like [Nylanderia fulva]XP_029168556.1 uncharacterized protein PFB0765w-like [Nylanderia fulva]XP_029168557.1 uncharacterized protein PFB0765w-like [Nylanderia fulva]XP_029168558.1 uncharacterized protein PFB0765w-like [Nylanderia fulva]
MSRISNSTCSKRSLMRSISAQQTSCSSEENVFCTEDGLEQSLHIINEEFESFGISSIPTNNVLQVIEPILEPFKKLLIKLINASWNLTRKYRSLMQSYDKLDDLNHKTVNDNMNLKNHVKRLKEEVQKKEQIMCETYERERRLQVQCDNLTHDLKQAKEEIRKLKKQAQSKDAQHEHAIKRIIHNGQKVEEQLRKYMGTYTSKDKVLQTMQTNHEKELTSYKQTICRLEENNRQMLEEINNLKQTLELYKSSIDLNAEASGWNNTDDI